MDGGRMRVKSSSRGKMRAGANRFRPSGRDSPDAELLVPAPNLQGIIVRTSGIDVSRPARMLIGGAAMKANFRSYTRREMLALAGRVAAAGALGSTQAHAAATEGASSVGAVVGEAHAAEIGLKILQDGGNAIDAAVAAAFAAGITSPGNSGIGGYGGHAMIALAGGRKITAIDFNSAAPAAARPDMFPLDARGNVVGNVNTVGWRAVGVPGVLAGLDLARQRYGTRSLREVLAPVIELCDGGTFVKPAPGVDDRPPPRSTARGESDAGLPREQQRNRALSGLLKALAGHNSAEPFYRGELATTLANAFQRNGGLVTRADLAAYRAREVTPLSVTWNGATVHTAPLTASGLLCLQALHSLQELGWARRSVAERLHAKLEALRLAWADRTRTWGDPEFVPVPVDTLLSAAHAGAAAAKIDAAVSTGRCVPVETEPSRADGTTNLCAVDSQGNMAAITVTHGSFWGARVLVPEFGLVLGNGLSRFDPRPDRPNSIAPGKRPVDNMCPTIITRGGVPVVAVGGGGGIRIPSGVTEVLLNLVGLGASLTAAVAATRLSTDGTLEVGLERSALRTDGAFFEKLGYKPTRLGGGVNISAVEFDPATHECRSAARRAS